MISKATFIALCLVFSMNKIALCILLNDAHSLNERNVCHPERFLRHAWCLPNDYTKADEPFQNLDGLNKTLPWNYDFNFIIREFVQISGKKRTVTFSMYFTTAWEEPRLQINENSTAWNDSRMGPEDQVNISPKHITTLWNPMLEIYGLEEITRYNVLGEMSGLRIGRNKTVFYELLVSITISCKMHFISYPFDVNFCHFQVGSYYGTNETIKCTSRTTYHETRQRNMPYYISLRELGEESSTVLLDSGLYNVCGFEMVLKRKWAQLVMQTYIPTCMVVMVSWVSFFIKPEVVAARMALLVTLILCLTTMHNGVKQNAPSSSRLNAVDLYMIVSFIFVFAPLVEYAFVLLHLRNFRKLANTTRVAEKPSIGNVFRYVGVTVIGKERAAQAAMDKSGNCKNLASDKKQDLGTIDTYASADNVFLCILIVLFVIFNVLYVIIYSF